MTSIDEIVLKSINPFDNYAAVNFWHKQQNQEPTIESIHTDAIAQIEATLEGVAKNRCTRTLMLHGDPGSGKTYLLGRLKKAFNHKAFFAYIPPFPQSDRIWRHILRYTVDSLIQVPDGQQNSQLLLWLKSVLSAIEQRSIKERILKDDVFDLIRSDRQKFINKLKDNTDKQLSIYNAECFFGVLHDLLEPEKYTLACDWLRGEDLSEESLQTLKIKNSIQTEEGAHEILANFSRIAADTQPIVLCFDQLESIARLSDGLLDLQTLFSVNTKIHDEGKNFLLLISITTDTWRSNQGRIDQSHKDRIDEKVALKQIKLPEAEALLATRLFPLHHQAIPQPSSSIYPLKQQYLEAKFPGAKTTPRNVLKFGRDVFQQYKEWLFKGSNEPFQPLSEIDKPTDLLAAFKLKWVDEFTKAQQRITRIRQFSSLELIQMLQEVLTALEIESEHKLLLSPTFSSYSLSYQPPSQRHRFGVVWTEDPNMATFFNVMNACQKTVQQNLCQSLQLIRFEGVGQSALKGYKLYQQIFTGSSHPHIKPNLTSVHYLATYYSLIKDAREGDLVVGGEIIGLKNLKNLIQESKVLSDCPLLQDLNIIPSSGNGSKKGNGTVDKDRLVREFLLSLAITQKVLGLQTLIHNTVDKFPQISETQVEQLIQHLCQTKQIQLLNPKDSTEKQLVCLIPKS